VSDHAKTLRVTWTKSAIGYAGNQKRTIAALGLRRLHQTVEHHDTASIRGMIATVPHLVSVQEGSESMEGSK
jgi:large subunit ribosomal protein L30